MPLMGKLIMNFNYITCYYLSIINFFVYFLNRVPDVPVEWTPISPSQSELVYLHIKGPGQYAMDSEKDFGHISLWNSIDFAEGKVAGKRVEL